MLEYHVKQQPVEKLRGQEGVTLENFHQIKDSEFKICDEKTGEVLILVVPAPFNVSHFETACQTIKYVTADRNSGLVQTSKTFGFQPRTPTRLRDYCRSSEMSTKQPSQHGVMEAGAKMMEDIFKAHLPQQYQSHKSLVESAIGERWRMQKGIFTSGIVNKNNQLRYHVDSNNMPGTWSGMLVMKKGVDGGHLVVPELQCELWMPHRSLIFFNGQKYWHAVTPWRRTQFDGYRYSIVWYTIEAMCKCLTPEEEIKRASKARTELERKRLAKEKDAEL